MRDLPIVPRPSAAMLLPLLVACERDKDAAEACESLMTALCAAGDDDTCGLGEPTAGACPASDEGMLRGTPVLSPKDAEACVALLREPECGSSFWEADVERCVQLPGACVDGEGGGGAPSDPGEQGGQLDSCDWVETGLCFEFDGYSGAEGWCLEVAQGYGQVASYYGGEGCPAGGEGPCVFPAGGDFPVSTDAYNYGVDGPRELCEDAGGVWRG
jgi:hypothetical protein